MGGFLIIKREPGFSVEEVERKFSASITVFQKKAIPLKKKVVTPEHIVYIFNKYRNAKDNAMQFKDGDTIIATGTMFYNGKTGKTALKELFQDFSIEKQDFLSNLLGNYCLIIYKSGKLFICNSSSGVYRVYSNLLKTVVSSSFLAVLRSVDKIIIEPHELYEYVFDGTFHGEKTLFKDIHLIDATSILQLCPITQNMPKNHVYPGINVVGSFGDMISEVSKSLIDYFGMIKANFGNNVCSGLTAGSDTRLMLACMRNVGIKPYLYVYGGKEDDNVTVAKMIAKGEGLKLDVIDRNNFPLISKDYYPVFLEKQHYLIDGLGYAGIFDNGSDLSTRFKRIEKAQLQLNGAGDLGTLYYSWPNKKISLKSMVKCKYDHGNYSMCRSDYFDKTSYLLTLQDKIKHILKAEEDRISRHQLEMLLPLLRIKYWTGNNHMVNNQLSDALVPFCEPKLINMVMEVPYKYKYMAVFKAAIIKSIDPSLSKYISPQYGYSFFDYHKIPIKLKIETFMKYHIPADLRPFIRAHYISHNKQQNEFPYFLSKKYLDLIFPKTQLAVSDYIDITKISDPEMLSRVLSVELLINGRF